MANTISGNNGITFPSGYTQGDVGIGSSATAQTWQDVTASRSNNTNYVNNTGRAIQVNLYTGTGTGSIAMTVNGVLMEIGYGVTSQIDGGGGCIVPAGATYSANCTANPTSWFEFR